MGRRSRRSIRWLSDLSLGSYDDGPGPRPGNEPGPAWAWGLFQHGRARPGRRGQKKARPAHPAGPARTPPRVPRPLRGPKRARPRAGRAVATAGPDPGRGLIALTARTLAPRARGQPTQRASRRQLESATEHERTPTRPLATVQSQAASQHFLNWNRESPLEEISNEAGNYRATRPCTK
jgi:hypothetical protein